MILALAYLLLRTSPVQTFLTRRIAAHLEERTHTPIKIRGVDISPFKTIILEGLYIEDFQKDTLIYIDELKAHIDSINLSRKKLYLKKIMLDKTVVKLWEDENLNLNINSFVDSLSKGSTPDTTAGESWQVAVSQIDMTRSRFAYKTADFVPQSFGMNYDDIEVNNIQLEARNIRLEGDTLDCDIKKLSCSEKSGFVLKELKGHNRITNRQWALSNVSIRSNYSKLVADHLNFNYIPGQGYWRHFTKKMKLDYVVRTSQISFLDLAYFNERLLGFRETGYLSGRVYGTVYDLKGKDIDIQYGDNTHLSGHFYMNGLPYVKDAYLEADFEELTTTIADIEKIYIPGYSQEHISLPSQFDNLGMIRYKGKFNGFINDFVFYGNFDTELGTLKTDILFKPSPEENKLKFKGDLRTTDFNLGGLMEQEKVGRITMNAAVNGFSSPSGVEGKLKGTINQLQFYNYDYINLVMDGKFSDNMFDGQVSILDPNIGFDFRGIVDFSRKIPTINFSSHLRNARLYPLHLNTQDSVAELSLSLAANFTGSGIDNANGLIEVSDVDYKNSLGNLKLDKITMNSSATPKLKWITLNSDFADARVEGNYDVRRLISSMENLVYYYLPAYATNEEYERLDTTNHFKFDLTVKETKAITEVLYPEVSIAPDSKISGQINAKEHQLEMQINSPELVWDGKSMNELKVTLNTNNDKLVLKGRTNQLAFSDNFRIYNLAQEIEAGQNKFNFDLMWNNWDAVTYSGYLSAETQVSRKSKKANPLTEINLLSSTVIMADSVWNIQPSKVTIDSTSVRIEDFRISRKNQFFSIDGVISEQPRDSIALRLQDISLRNLNAILGSNNLRVNGDVKGYVEVSDFYHDRLSNSNIHINNLTFNADTLGDLYLISHWNKVAQKLTVSSFSNYNHRKEMDFYGDYYPETNSMDFKMTIDHFRLKLLQPYLQETLSDLDGYTSGRLTLSGKSNAPQFNGKIYMQDAQFKVNELQTHYHCNDSITLTPTQIQFNQFMLSDPNNNLASLTGYIQHDNFGDVNLDLALRMNNFQVLNTKASDNEMAYGKAFISGLMRLSGKPDNLDIDISAKTERDSRIFIPLNSSSDIQESHFITFVNKYQTTFPPEEEEYKIDLAGLRMNCELDITPEAEIQIIFDSKIGDILKARGNGNMKLEIDTKGDFKMFGQYTIQKGSYLFTLQDVINKKFDLENGGTIKWNGNPYDAMININALYKLKTSLYDLALDLPGMDVSRKVPVECKMNLSNRLENPNIRFDINFPTLDLQTQNILEDMFMSEDEINKQILSLLVLNRFYTPEYRRDTDPDFENKNSSYAVGVTTSEMLSNQLSNWLSQISNDFDIGVSYRPGDEITSDEIELALSTQIFNDRVTINGNVGTTSDQERDNDIVGDFDVNIKLDKKGKLQLKAFTRSNERLLYEENRNKQGVGIFYREDFNSFSNLLKRYLNFLRGKKKEE